MVSVDVMAGSVNVKRQVANPMYEADVNRYGVKCGKCGRDGG